MNERLDEMKLNIYVMQYQSKRRQEYVDKYLLALSRMS